MGDYMKKAFVFVIAAAFVLIGVGLSGYFKDEAKIFTDSTGVAWIVLTEDDKGNRLIITEITHGSEPAFSRNIFDYPHLLVQYNSRNIFTCLSGSDELRPVLNAWFTDILAPEIREIALPAHNLDNDVRSEPGFEGDSFEALTAISKENKPAGWTRAGTGTAAPENSLFVLSISEVNKYQELGSLNKYGNSGYWLRSPGLSSGTVSFMSVDASTGRTRISCAHATERLGLRPALWIRPSSY